MSTLIIGGKGNMGKRYASILKHLNSKYDIVDVHNLEKFPEKAAVADRFIIATPTETHLDYIKQLIPMNKPILCEKPLSRDIQGLREALESQGEKDLVFMVNNYGYAYHISVDTDSKYLDAQVANNVPGITSYNYYNSGPDGLVWDCIQLIRMAQGPIMLSKHSPIWSCVINGVQIDRSAIDTSYVLMIADFVGGFIHQDRGEIIELHEEVEGRNVEFITSDFDQYWGSSTDYEHEVTE
jgi:hypothetical protein